MRPRTKTLWKISLMGFAYLALAIIAILIADGSNENTTQSIRDQIVEKAKSHLDDPYVYGGTGQQGFDCSGFTGHVYAFAGFTLPRSSAAQFNHLQKTTHPRPGDLVFFRTEGDSISHVGIYLGDNRFIHAPSSGKRIRISRLNSNYWKERFAGAATPFE